MMTPLTTIQYVLLGLILVALTQVPPAQDCSAQLNEEHAQSATCSPGPDGRNLPGIQGRPGRDCNLVLLPNGRYGCRYDDGTFSEYERSILPEFQGIRPVRFWWVLGVLTLLVGAGSWKIFFERA